MEVEVSLYAGFSQYLPENAAGQDIRMELEEGTTIEQVLVKLGVPLETVKLVFLNKVRTDTDTVLQNGDGMGVFPPMSGG